MTPGAKIDAALVFPSAEFSPSGRLLLADVNHPSMISGGAGSCGVNTRFVPYRSTSPLCVRSSSMSRRRVGRRMSGRCVGLRNAPNGRAPCPGAHRPGPGSRCGRMNGSMMHARAMNLTGMSRGSFGVMCGIWSRRRSRAGGAQSGTSKNQGNCPNTSYLHPAKILSTSDFMPRVRSPASRYSPLIGIPAILDRRRLQHRLSCTLLLPRSSAPSSPHASAVAALRQQNNGCWLPLRSLKTGAPCRVEPAPPYLHRSGIHHPQLCCSDCFFQK